MQAPDAREPIPLRYLRVRASVIPLEPHEKRPYLDVLEGRTWAPYQQRRASDTEVLGWLAHGHDHNWGVVCGQVSDGLYCGDVDDPDFAVWVLDHARDPLLRGACVVRSGSGKAHIWFRSPNKLLSGKWKPSRGRAVGDIRGDGNGSAGPSYMVVPPSVHPDTGEPYRYIAHNFADLPSIDNGAAFLTDILGAYLNESLGGLVEEPSNSKDILILSDEDRTRVWGQVRTLGLKRKILDTLIREGNQDPGTRHWIDLPDNSHSGIDFVVVKELIAKNQTYDQIEEIFAATLVGAARYRNKDPQKNYGYSYLKLTYDSARKSLFEAQQASQLARGINFVVTGVRRTVYGAKDSIFILTVDCTWGSGSTTQGHEVRLDVDDLHKMDSAKREFMAQLQFTPRFSQNQQGRAFAETFGQAVMDMARDDVENAPEAETRFGLLANRTRGYLRSLPELLPRTRGEMPDRVGWRHEGLYYLNGAELYEMWRSFDHAIKPSEAREILKLLGQYHQIRHRWVDGIQDEMIVLNLIEP